jgi:predicted pyridoxine 5'-phosphate oxidase superfamily flavin-nucleotide-binding protein
MPTTATTAGPQPREMIEAQRLARLGTASAEHVGSGMLRPAIAEHLRELGEIE